MFYAIFISANAAYGNKTIIRNNTVPEKCCNFHFLALSASFFLILFDQCLLDGMII